MATETMNRVMQQVEALVAVLSPTDKLALANHLAAQAKLDAANDMAAKVNDKRQTAEKTEGPDPHHLRDLEWLKQHDKEYAGQYVALAGGNLIAHAETLRELDQLVKAVATPNVAITRIPASGEVLFGGW